MLRRTPSLGDFTPTERRLVESLRTPHQVQRYLRSLPYNWEHTLRTFRGVAAAGRVACLEAVLFTATVLEQHGYPPLALDIESQDRLDHVLFVYRSPSGWGTVARSRDEGLHGRKPVFPTLGSLVRSYMDPYVDGSGRVVGYGVFDIDDLVRVDWRLGETNVWSVERTLFAREHTPIHMGERRYRSALRRFTIFKEDHPAPTARDWRRHFANQAATWL